MPKLIQLLLGRRELALKLIRPEGESQPVLAAAHPQAQDAESRRLRAMASRGATSGPRAAPPHTIDLPLDTRTGTILYHQLPPEDRAALDGHAPAGNTGRRKD